MRAEISLAIAACLLAGAATAAEMPTRKAGLWEVKMIFEGRNLPPRVMRQCTDPAADKLMNSGAEAGPAQCSKRDIQNIGNTIVIDSVCSFGAGTTASHTVVTGSFDSAYTMAISSKREGGPAVPGMPAESRMTLEAKWLGPCEPGMRPGDVVTNGMKMNVLDMQKMRAPQR